MYSIEIATSSSALRSTLDRGYVYLSRHRGQHRPACCSLTHYYDIPLAGMAKHHLLVRETIILSALKILNGKHSSRVECSCEALIAARCNRLKMDINDKPHLAKSEKVMNHISQLFQMKPDTT